MFACVSVCACFCVLCGCLRECLLCFLCLGGCVCSSTCLRVFFVHLYEIFVMFVCLCVCVGICVGVCVWCVCCAGACVCLRLYTCLWSCCCLGLRLSVYECLCVFLGVFV